MKLTDFSRQNFFAYKVTAMQGKTATITPTKKFTPPSDQHHIGAHSHLHTANADPAADSGSVVASTSANNLNLNPTRTSYPAADATTNATDAASSTEDVAAR